MFNWLWGRPAEKPDYSAAKSLFEEHEIALVEQTFKKLVETTTDELNILQRLTLLPDDALAILGQSLLNVIKESSPEREFDAQRILVAKALCERKGEEASLAFSFRMIAQGAQTVSRERLAQVVQACGRVLGVTERCGGECEQWAQAAAAGALRQQQTSSSMMTTGTGSGVSGGDGREVGMSLEGYKRWFGRLPAVQQVLSSLLVIPADGSTHAAAAGPGEPSTSATSTSATSTEHPPTKWGHFLPTLVVSHQYNCRQLLLQPHWAWLLSSRLPPDEKQEWRLLFSSYRDGGSFNTFMAKATGSAPTLLLVRDKEGRLFGGYAPLPWQKQGTFYGEFATSIFALEPETLIYPATGINSNFQWCGVNFSQLPNGVGFGGQPGHFALFVDSSFEDGMSRPAATFANAPLSSNQTFKVDSVECWLLKPPEEDELSAAGGGSILDRNKEDQKLLELAGVKGNFSAGYRDAPAEPIE